MPWTRSESKTSAGGVVVLARALQMSRSAAAADSVEASSGVLQAPTLEKFVRDLSDKDGLGVKALKWAQMRSYSR